MLDGKVTLFEISLPKTEADFVSAQVISGCNAYIGQVYSGEHKIYSELEEDSYVYLNNNDYNGKVLEVEICLRANKDNIYSDFYARCVAIRTDNGLRIKMNGFRNNKHNSRINMKGETVIGIGLFLRDEDYNGLIEAKRFGIEGAFALGKPNITYGFNIDIMKSNGSYTVQAANTYKLKNTNINNMAH